MARFLKLSALALGLTAAAEATEPGCEHGARGCAAAVADAEDAGLGLLQQGKAAKAAAKKHRHRSRSIREDPNATVAVWDQIKGAVHIDELQAQLQKALGNDTVAQLTAQIQDLQQQFPSAAAVQIDELQADLQKALGNDTIAQLTAQIQDLQQQFPSAAAVQIDELQAELQKALGNDTIAQLTAQIQDLQQQFPSAAEVQQQFSSEWANLTAAVNLDSLEAEIQHDKLNGNATLQDLEAQYESLKAQLPAVNITEVQDKAVGYYEDLLDAGIPLPDVDTVSNLTNQAVDAVSDMANSAVDAASAVGNSVSDAFNDIWR